VRQARPARQERASGLCLVVRLVEVAVSSSDMANQHCAEKKRTATNTYILLPFTIQLFQLFVKDTTLLEIMICFIQPERASSVLDRIVRVSLNMLMQDKPGQETE
jgi:hypothetical protein